jgi:hypothetical protein
VLVVNRKFGIANDVDEQDMTYLKLDFLFDFGGHLLRRPNYTKFLNAPRQDCREHTCTESPRLNDGRLHPLVIPSACRAVA